MSEEDLRAERDALLVEARSLADQVKQLNRAERSLYLAQNENDRQFRRIRSLGDFTLKASQSLEVPAILADAIDMLLRIFPFDTSLALVASPAGGLVPVLFRGHDRTVAQPLEGFGALECPAGLVNAGPILRRPLPSSEADEGFARLIDAAGAALQASDGELLHGPVAEPSVLWTPFRARNGELQGAMISSISLAKKIPFILPPPVERDVPFFRLFSSHVESALENAKLYRRLRDFAADLEATVLERTRQLREANAELARNLRELRETQGKLVSVGKMAALGEMAGGIAHELNTPLAVIATTASRMQEKIPQSVPNRVELITSAGLIEDTAFRIARIISGLRAFSRDGTHDPMVPARLRTIIDETLAFCGAKFREHGILIEVGDVPEDLRVTCRATQISQVLLNLLSNAYDAISGRPGAWVRVNVDVSTQWIEISVTDSGSGIPAALRESLFQPFFTTKEPGKGTGLGLSVSKGLTEAHQGELLVDAECSNTRFVIRLPREAAVRQVF